MTGSSGRLAGKVAIVTAAGQGIGEGIARRFAAEGARLVLTGRTGAKVERVAADLRQGGAEAIALEALAGDAGQADQTVAAAIAAFGRVDILVNNAHSFTKPVPVEDMPEENMLVNFQSGTLGSLQLMQRVFPHMRDGGGGAIVNVGSSYAVRAEPGYLAYAAAKEAIRALSKTAAREWGRYKIRVNTLLPAALSPMARKYLQESGRYDEEVGKTAIGYIGEAEADVAPVVVFLCSDDGHYVTGQSISADGGSLLVG